MDTGKFEPWRDIEAALPLSGRPFACLDEGQVLYMAPPDGGLSGGAVDRVYLSGRLDNSVSKNTLNVGIDKPLAAFRLSIEPSAIGKPAGSVFDLILG